MADEQPSVPEESVVLVVEDRTSHGPEDVEEADSDKSLELQSELDSTDTSDKSSIQEPSKSSPSDSTTISKLPHNPALLKPLEAGWRRELVFRNPTGDNKRRVDVYYYTPSGLKLRSLKSIGEHLEGSDLTLDNFTFAKSSVGVDDPAKEVVRNAKRNSEESSGSAKKRKTLPKTVRKTCKLKGTPRVVLRNVGADDECPLGNDNLDDETCSWLPPLWGKLLTILNRQYQT